MSELTRYAMVFVGGGAGSCARYLVQSLVQARTGADTPWGTFVVNATGALLIGLLMEAFLRSSLSPNARILFVAGVLGGYTTFSAFCYEGLQLLQTRSYAQFAGYALGSTVIGIGACWLGMAIMRALLKG